MTKIQSKELKLFFTFIQKHLINYPTPINLNYLWGIGSLIGLFLVGQILSGILLAMHYTPHIVLAFESIEHIMRDINYGWFWRYCHANGASFIFILLYFHLCRGLYYSSYIYPYNLLWCSGIILFILMMATAFMGYVLPYGQMSFRGATVIINLFSAIPFCGSFIVSWLLGGYSVDNPTLNRFFSLHYLLPFLISGLTIIHLTLLHVRGSSNPLGISLIDDKISFYSYFYIKDLLGLLSCLFFLIIIIFFYPNLLGHSDNYIEANPLVTPLHIVPEWYFSPFYAILRSIPSKLGGVIAMAGALIILLLLPYFIILNTRKIRIIKNPKFKIFYKILYWYFVFNLFFLGYIGGHPVEEPYIILGQFSTCFYYLYILLILPYLLYEEKQLITSLDKNKKINIKFLAR
jgi:ubiquinol-cytochrome c reductase cytochrome b subunit